LALAYPHRTWRDAPLYPTPAMALQSLPAHLPLRAGARVLDAGCGLGHGLRALRRACPQAQLQGVEFSRPLAMLARLSCPWAQIHRGDMWALPWGDFHVVYLFQRPESMARAWAKACADMPPGSWLLSLEFEVPGQRPQAQWCDVPGKPVHAYQIGAAPMRRAPKV
jgi:SAM-dependent methyltransferase